MKLILLSFLGVILSLNTSFSQCSVQLNDSLYSNYNYVLNAINVTGQAPFQFNWTVTDGNGMNVPFTQNIYGDSITIDGQTIMNSYGCIIYQLCMTDALNCTTCTQGDTSALQVPFNCFSAFSSSIIGSNQVSIAAFNNIPPFLIMQQFLTWTDGQGQGQGMPYMGPGTILTYTPGPNNTSNQFFLCMMTNLTTGGCISCDSIPYTTLGLNEEVNGMFEVYPNPTDQLITVHSYNELEQLSVSTSSGQILMTVQLEGKKEHQLDLSDIPSGIYFVELTTQSGIRVKKLVIKK